MEHNQKWYEQNGYLDVDMDIFAEGLSLVFMYNMDYPCYYSKMSYTYEDNKGEKDTRYIYVISPNKYPKNITKPFGDENHSFNKKDENDTMFRHKPLRFIDEAYILKFTSEYREKEIVHLGSVYNQKFYPAILVPFDSFESYCETEYEHFDHSFVQEFMARIFQYKLENKKPTITMDDMYVILESYGFSRKKEMERLATVLKRTEEQSQEEKSTPIGRVFKKEEK